MIFIRPGKENLLNYFHEDLSKEESEYRVTPIDVLLLQLGTPSAPTAPGLRPYLREFLSDPRVLEMAAWKRWLLVNAIIVPFRSPKSAAKYQRIWDEREGSPLLRITKRQTVGLQEILGPTYRVHFAMRYGQPSIASVVRAWKDKCQRLVVVPMFPQYSATTTASGLDALFDALKTLRRIPALRVIRDYHDDPGYINAVAHGIERERLAAEAAGRTPELFILSFHGIPRDYIRRGDPYQRQSSITARAVAKRLGWRLDQWRLAFQSRLGRAKWLEPYTDELLKSLGHQGIRRVLIAQPGFTTDCLETIDEIGYEGTQEFREGGGEDLIRVPCLNDDPHFLSALKNLVEREAVGWR